MIGIRWMRQLLALACLSVLFLVATAASASRIDWATTKLKEKKIGQDSTWKIDIKIFLDRTPEFANMPVKFEFKQIAYYERYMEGESDKVKLRTVPITGKQPLVESVDIGFLDPSSATIQKRTRFAFEITRAHGFECGEYEVSVRNGRNGALIGATTRLTLEGENEVIDRRTMSFAGADEKKKDKKEGEEGKGEEEEKKSRPSGPVEEDETEWPEDRSGRRKGPPPVEEKRGCGCRIVEADRADLTMGVWLGLGLCGALALRRRRADQRPN